MPSPDCWKSLKVRNPRTMRSRMINKDQRSPNTSREMLTGHPDRCLRLLLPRGTGEHHTTITCKMQVVGTEKIRSTKDRIQMALFSEPVGLCNRADPDFLVDEIAARLQSFAVGFEQLYLLDLAFDDPEGSDRRQALGLFQQGTHHDHVGDLG